MSRTVKQHEIDQLQGRMLTIYEVVPLQEWWNVNQLHFELTRLGKQWTKDHVTRVVRELVNRNVVRERNASLNYGEYQRTPVRKPATATTLTLVENSVPKSKSEPSFEQLMCMLAEVRTQVQQGRALIDQAARTLGSLETYVSDLEQHTHEQDNAEVEGVKAELEALMERVKNL